MYLQRKELFLVKFGEPVGASCYCRYRKEQGGERNLVRCPNPATTITDLNDRPDPDPSATPLPHQLYFPVRRAPKKICESIAICDMAQATVLMMGVCHHPCRRSSNIHTVVQYAVGHLHACRKCNFSKRRTDLAWSAVHYGAYITHRTCLSLDPLLLRSITTLATEVEEG